jgi:magnesium-dependent phosphatase 1
MFELQYDEMWWNTRVGISSRTDQPVWARELLDKFVIDYPEDGASSSLPAFPLRQIFTPELCELAKDDKREHFERILSNAPCNLKFTDCMFFDNELGNCQAASWCDGLSLSSRCYEGGPMLSILTLHP